MKLKALLALGAILALGFTSSQAQQGKQLSLATGGTGGVYYPLGGGFASLVGKFIPGYTATAEVTGGSVANLQLIGSKKAELAFTQVDAAWDAVNGLEKFASGKIKVRALVVMYPNNMHVVTIEGTGINSLADLKGKRVSTGSPGSATEVFAFRVIEAAGLDKDKDMKRERLGVAESVNALKDKKIDAFFWVGGLPTAAITDLAATPNVKIKLLDYSQLVPKMVAKYGNIYASGVIPKATYKGMEKDAQIATVWNLFAVHEDMDEKLAYDLTKLMLEKRDDLALVHAEGRNIKPEWQTKGRAGIPFHKGALKYFAEKGIKIE
ncbi:MAG: TAXI family TRAP transporter solute-binding subunit [Hyphomicrobiaceae bacterium]|nr:MAG: TAXI family TRAP transporter solute-binding subunit [Hyphomicrobiaceae bacterium]